MKIRTVIIDDEELARSLVRNYLSKFNEIEIVEECENGFEGARAIRDMKPDLVFLDIQMPKLNGFEMLELIDEKPCVIFTTAYDEFAIRAFEVNAIDYLLKPFSEKRFQEAIDRAKQKIGEKDSSESEIKRLDVHLESTTKLLERVVVKKKDQLIVIPVHTILYIESEDDYVMIWSDEGKFLKQKTMKFFEEHLDSRLFVRIHRSFIVNLEKIDSIQLYEKDTYLVLLKNGSKIRASRQGYSRLKEVM
ncbi:MAG: LytTR family transcriptional regulator DNA-binding domain-containing protein [Bacteroidetes bacterium]|nr:LytTR family transcriptional regulator DNA-binding domain-containing protein [Bacteroidota bacterium]